MGGRWLSEHLVDGVQDVSTEGPTPAFGALNKSNEVIHEYVRVGQWLGQGFQGHDVRWLRL